MAAARGVASPPCRAARPVPSCSSAPTAPSCARRASRLSAEPRTSAHGLADADQVPFAVAEPRAPLATTFGRVIALDVGDAVDRAQAGDVDLLEDDAASPQFGDDGLDVLDLERHLGVITRSGAGRLEHGEIPAATPVPQAALSFLDRLQAELLGIEGTGPLEVLGREPGGDFSAFQQCHTSYDLPCRRRSSVTRGPPGRVATDRGRVAAPVARSTPAAAAERQGRMPADAPGPRAGDRSSDP